MPRHVHVMLRQLQFAYRMTRYQLSQSAKGQSVKLQTQSNLSLKVWDCATLGQSSKQKSIVTIQLNPAPVMLE